MRLSASTPSACQKLICGKPKSGGSRAFHRYRTIWPPAAANNTTASITTGTQTINRLFMFRPSSFREFDVNALQPLPQPPHRVPLARQERVHAEERRVGEE